MLYQLAKACMTDEVPLACPNTLQTVMLAVGDRHRVSVSFQEAAQAEPPLPSQLPIEGGHSAGDPRLN